MSVKKMTNIRYSDGLWEYFHEAVICRSLGLKAEEDWLTKTMYKKILKDGANIAALDKEVVNLCEVDHLTVNYM